MDPIDPDASEVFAGLFIVLQPGGAIDRWNRACTELSGLELEEVRGRKLWELLPVPDEAARVKEALQRLEADRRRSTFACTWQRASGERRTIAFVGTVTSGVRDRPQVLVLSGVDVTVLIAASLQEVLDERQVVAAFLEASSDFVGIADPDYKPVYVNRAGRRMVGLPLDFPVETTRIEDYYPPEQRAFVDRVIMKTVKEKGQWKGETYFRHWQTEKPIPVSDEHFLIRDPQTGRVLGMGTITRDISDLEKVADHLRQSQERFELALRGADLAAWDWNIETGEVVFSPRWAEMRGWRLEEIRHHVDTWLSGVHPEDLPQVQRVLTDYFEGRIPDYETEHRVRTRSGDWIWILDRGKIFARDEKGRPTRMVGTERDITGRKQREEIRLSEARSSGIVSISADAIVSVDEQQRITLFNDGAEKLFGCAKAEVLGAPLDILIPERFRSDHWRHVQAFAAGPEGSRRMGTRGEEILGLRKNGEEFPADATISKLVVGGKTILTVAVRDITEQKRREDEQRFLAEVGSLLATKLDYEETLSAIAQLAVRELSEICVMDMVDEDGEIRRRKVACRAPSNAWICDVELPIALHRDPFLPVWSVLETKQPLVLPETSAQLLNPGSRDEERLRALREIGPVSVVAVPLLVHGKVVGVMNLVSTTSARALDHEVVPLALELAGRAALSLENARLYREAQRAIAARDDVLGVVAHDLRNPLGNILLQAALMRTREKTKDRPLHAPAEAIERAANRMNRLIQDLLDVTRLEAGHLAVEQTRLPVAQVFSELLESQRSLCASAGIDLRVEASANLPDLWADRDRLLQIFENFIGNALEFTGRGGSITVGAIAQDTEVCFWVRDTGTGIRADELDHVFDRFWRARQGRGRGGGLGLAIVKGLVEAHAGRVWAESTPGRGSTFFFTMPSAPPLRGPSAPHPISPMARRRHRPR